MPREPHPIDGRPSLSLIAASILIVSLGVLGLAAHVHPRTGSMQVQPTDATATEAVAEFGD
ncbi:MAG TPA: hypothetical protein VEJ89_06780 [Myxococcaceae bacterium]|nr:hypothetical protein [Myxococcaceae bacterium]